MLTIKGFKNNIFVCITYLKDHDQKYVTLAPDHATMDNAQVLIDFIKSCARENIEIIEFVPCRALKANNPQEVELYHLLERYNIKANWKPFIPKRK